MSAIRWAIIAVGQFCVFLVVICLTVGGGYLGYLFSNPMGASGNNSILDAIRNFDISVWVGAVVGFIISMVIAAAFFAVVEIARNTSERWFH
jgi:uncharacterized protein YacL